MAIKSETEAKPTSSTEIMQALQPYLASGPSGLAVRIGTKNITLKREQRVVTLPRSASLDALIDNAVELTGPLTTDEVTKLFQPYEGRGISMRIDHDVLYLTRKPHTATFRTHDGKIKNSSMRERTVISSLDVPMAHIIGVLNDMVQGGEIFE